MHKSHQGLNRKEECPECKCEKYFQDGVMRRGRQRRGGGNDFFAVSVSAPFFSPFLCNHSPDVPRAQRPAQYLVLEHGSPEGPDRSEDKIELIKFLGRVWRGVFGSQQTLQQVAQHLDHTLLRDGNDLLKPERKKKVTKS